MPSKGPSWASALMAMLAFHEVVTTATKRASPACHIEVPSRLLHWAVPRHPRKPCFQAHRHRGEPTAGDSHRRTHLWLHLHTPGVGQWLKTEAWVEAEQREVVASGVCVKLRSVQSQEPVSHNTDLWQMWPWLPHTDH